MNDWKRIVVVIMSLLLCTSIAEARPHFKRGGTVTKGKKAPPNTLCQWGPSQTASPGEWQELRCGSDPKPYAMGNKDLSEVSVNRTVGYIEKIEGNTTTLSIQMARKEFFLLVPTNRFPKGIKTEQWLTVDPNVVKMATALDNVGELPMIKQEDMAEN